MQHPQNVGHVEQVYFPDHQISVPTQIKFTNILYFTHRKINLPENPTSLNRAQKPGNERELRNQVPESQMLNYQVTLLDFYWHVLIVPEAVGTKD